MATLKKYARPAHPNAANLFIDLVLSKEDGELLKSMGRVPSRGDEALSEAVESEGARFESASREQRRDGSRRLS